MEAKSSLVRAVGVSEDKFMEVANKEQYEDQVHLKGIGGHNLVGTHHKETNACAVDKGLVLLAYRQKH